MQNNETFQKGAVIKSGKYPRWNINGHVEWVVLDLDDNKALLLSRHIIDERIFDPVTNVWKDSEIRYWLNNDFIRLVFDDKLFSDRICDSYLNDVDTVDKVFLLSNSEFSKYLKNSYERFSISLKDSTTQTWLCRSAATVNDAVGVYGVSSYGQLVCQYRPKSVRGIRPAIWICK